MRWTPRTTSTSITCGIDAAAPETRPADLAERFQPGKYEVYILGDVDSTAFREVGIASSWPRRSTQGTGLIMLGGFHSFGPGGYCGDAAGRRAAGGHGSAWTGRTSTSPMRSDLHWPGPLHMRPTAQGLRHFALMLAGSHEQRTRRCGPSCRRWKGPTSSAGLRRRRGRAGRRRPDKPLLVAHNYRRRPRDGLRRRFHLALVDARIRGGQQAILAADRALAGTQGPGAWKAASG